MKDKIIIGIIVILAALTVWLLYSQNKPVPENDPEPPSQTVSDPVPSLPLIPDTEPDSIWSELPPSTLPVNEDGLVEAVVPENLLGGETAEEFYAGYLSDSEYQKLVTRVEINDDGRIKLFLTSEQLEQYRQNVYLYAQYPKSFNVKSIKEVVFENDMLTEITVFVDVNIYLGELLERVMCNAGLAAYAGKYQILTGIPPDEWHTTITIIDVNTDEILSKIDFPNEDMYSIL